MSKITARLVLASCILVTAAPRCATHAAEFLTALASIRGPDVQAIVDVLANDQFKGREAGSRGGSAAGEYLASQFQKRGLRGAGDHGGYAQIFRGNCRNLLGILEGRDPNLKNQFVMIGAHYDHVGYGAPRNSRGPVGYIHPGADDNASGVAGLLETVEAFKLLDDAPRRSLLFALWDAEEQGLWGSKHWLANPTVPPDKLAIVLNADMIGRMQDRQLKVFGTRTSCGLRRLVSSRNQNIDLFLEFVWDMKEDSDHHPFFGRGIPVLMFHTGLHEDYHRPGDKAERINQEGTEQASRLLFSVAHEVANRPVLGGFRASSRFESSVECARLEQSLPPAAPRFGVQWSNRTGLSGGFYVTEVVPGTPAERLEIRPGDRLLQFAHRDIESDGQLRAAILTTRSPVALVIQREDQEPLSLTVDLAGEPMRLGVSWREDDAEPGTLVLARVTYGSPAALAGLQVGDRIYQVAGHDFRNAAEFQQLLEHALSPWELLVERRGRVRTVTVNAP
jgi:hypothetical protein